MMANVMVYEGEALVTTTHASLVCAPWVKLPGGVIVSQVDDPDQPMVLLRDRAEVETFIDGLHAALDLSER
jgi:hypothetical protein